MPDIFEQNYGNMQMIEDGRYAGKNECCSTR